MATCSEPDCDRPVRGRGLCGTHYAYRRRHGTLPSLPERILTCTADGCDDPIGPAGAKGLCPKHYQRVTKSKWGLEQPPSTAPDDVRFWAKVDKSAGPEGCWPWLAGVNIHGYGNIWWNGVTRPAHRIAYELAKGVIPDGLALDHLCNVRHCVNPAHLEAVTTEVNNQRIPMTPQRRAKLAAAGRKGSASRWGSRAEQPE